MKKHLVFLTTFLFLGLSGTLALGSDELQVHVPFPFYVENTLLPSGDYIVNTMPGSESASMIRSRDGSTAVQFLTENALKRQPIDESELVFDVASGQHFLSQIWEVGSTYGWELEPSSSRQHAMAALNDSTSQQTLNLNKKHTS